MRSSGSEELAGEAPTSGDHRRWLPADVLREAVVDLGERKVALALKKVHDRIFARTGAGSTAGDGAHRGRRGGATPCEPRRRPLSGFAEGKDVFVYTHDHVRGDAPTCSPSCPGRAGLFERLLFVSGSVPKVALTILSAGAPEASKGHIGWRFDVLTSTPGVGKKAQRSFGPQRPIGGCRTGRGWSGRRGRHGPGGLGYQASVAARR